MPQADARVLRRASGRREAGSWSAWRDFGHNAAMGRSPWDVVIIGGGPAGAAAARLLATWGHTVQLITRTPDTTRSLGESLPPSCRKLFELLGVAAATDAAGFLTSTGNTVWWGDQTTRATRFSDSTTGLQVDRRRLDALLLRLAAEAGASVLTDALVRDVELAPARGHPGGTETTISYLTHDQRPHRVQAHFVLDCSGRAGVVARRGFRIHEARRTTLALSAVWERRGGWGLDDDTHTLVESYDDGWAWSVPVTPERRFLTVMVDPRVTDLDRRGALAACYDAELAKTTALRQMLARGLRETTPWGCDASVYHAHTYGAPGVLLVGDAASFIDPLSSYGVKKALASAWLAAVVVHTSLKTSALAGVALDLFNEREAEIYAATARQSAQFFGDAAARHHHPFWTGRAATETLADGRATGSESDTDVLREDPAVLAAFAALRSGDGIRLRRGERLRLEARPALTAREVVMEQRLVLPGWPSTGHGVRFLRGIDLVRLVELAPSHGQVPELYDAYNRGAAPVSLPDFLGALSVLLAKGALRDETPSSRSPG